MRSTRPYKRTITAKNEKENLVDSTVRVRHKHGDIKVLSQKLHEKCIDLSCSYGEKTILGKDNRKYVLNTIFKQVCKMLSLAIRS